MHPSLRRWTATLLACAMILSLPAIAQARAPHDGRPAAAPTKKAKVRKIALGVSQNPDFSLAALDAFTAKVGRKPAIWSIWSTWGGATRPFPTALVAGMRARGVVPQVFWEPDDPSTPPQGDDSPATYTFAQIAAGKYDDYIRQWARDAKAVGGTILLKFAHEMNAPWFPWGMGRAGGENNPESFKAAWRHVHDLIRGPDGEGATNVKMLWSFYGGGCACPVGASTLYPGDKYVQYTGFSTFDWDGNRTMRQLLTPGVQMIRKLTKKPIIVTETGTPAIAARKATWIRTGYTEVHRYLKAIKAIVYFDVVVPGQPDWRLASPLSGRRAYKKLLTKPAFQGRIS